MDRDFPCRCGHKEIVHPPNNNARFSAGLYEVCDGCFQKNRIKGVPQYGTIDCTRYVPDNLKYLEMQYNEKGS